LYGSNAQVVGIDEAQFFDDELPDVCVKLANRGVRVIIAGLDMDFEGRPFGPIPALMAIADDVTKVHAVCMKCGNSALFSYRLVENKNQVMLGEKESYEPRCRICFNLD
jgi:thymidine kinase